MPVSVREPNIDDATRMLVAVAEKPQAIKDADPAVLRCSKGVVRLTHAADRDMDRSPRRRQVTVQLRGDVVKALQQPRKDLHLLHVRNAQELKDSHVLVSHLRPGAACPIVGPSAVG